MNGLMGANKVKAVIFDFDGTMADSNWVWKLVNKQFLSEHNIQYDDTLKKVICGMSSERIAQYLIQTYHLTETKGEIMKRWNELAQRYYVEDVTLKEGMELFLYNLKKRGIKTGIATGGAKELILLFLKKYGLNDFIDIIVDTGVVEKGKPFPDIFQYVAKTLGVECEECLVYEDAVPSLKAAASLGMGVCLVEDRNRVSDVLGVRQFYRCVHSFINESDFLQLNVDGDGHYVIG